jgi:hypothetical protein
MTRITLPIFVKDLSHEECSRFPRTALDGPQAHNAYRRFPLGNNEELAVDEITVLFRAFWQSRQGQHYQSGDLLLIDNIRFGHGRESFSGKRLIGARFWTDDVSQGGV